VALTTGLGYLCALPLPRWIGIDPRWGVAGLTASAGVAGWVEFALLRRTLNRRIGSTGLPATLAARLWVSAGVAAAAGWGVKLAMGQGNAILLAATVLAPYGLVYFGAAAASGVTESAELIDRLRPAGRRPDRLPH
jgi:putative peptidoglycan lipid II flippase